eukprot:4802103-Pleurochrysis_carterae.AAC.2
MSSLQARRPSARLAKSRSLGLAPPPSGDRDSVRSESCTPFEPWQLSLPSVSAVSSLCIARLFWLCTLSQDHPSFRSRSISSARLLSLGQPVPNVAVTALPCFVGDLIKVYGRVDGRIRESEHMARLSTLSCRHRGGGGSAD